MSEMSIAALICSDRAASGERQDVTAERLRVALDEAGMGLREVVLVADQQDAIAEALRRLAEHHDVVLTSGGTGIGPRDVTPEATRAVIEREIPGMAEAMRARSLAVTKMAMLSRATAGVLGGCLIINLPGSPKGAVECLEVVLPVIRHGHRVLRGEVADCQKEMGP